MENGIFQVGISGSYGGLNMGDEAILQSIIKQLRESLPVEITVFTRDPEDTITRHKVENAVPVRELSISEIRPEIKRLDMLILGGGGILYDEDAHHYLREVFVAREENVPVMVYAISAGPLKSSSVQSKVADALNGVSAISVRDKVARQVLEQAGVRRDIRVTADPALLMESEDLKDISLNMEYFKEDRKIVGMSVREPGAAAPDIDEVHYHRLLADTADFIIDRFGAHVVFIPMERKKLDLQHSHAVISKMLRPQYATVLEGDYTPGQLIKIMSKFEFAVGMRLHFLIFALIQHIPLVGLPYSSKVRSFLLEMGMNVPPINLVNSGRLIAYIDQAWDNRESLQQKMVELLPDLRRRARENNDIALRVLKGERF